jgi:hypothetical protein
VFPNYGSAEHWGLSGLRSVSPSKAAFLNRRVVEDFKRVAGIAKNDICLPFCRNWDKSSIEKSM